MRGRCRNGRPCQNSIVQKRTQSVPWHRKRIGRPGSGNCWRAGARRVLKPANVGRYANSVLKADYRVNEVAGRDRYGFYLIARICARTRRLLRARELRPRRAEWSHGPSWRTCNSQWFASKSIPHMRLPNLSRLGGLGDKFGPGFRSRDGRMGGEHVGQCHNDRRCLVLQLTDCRLIRRATCTGNPEWRSAGVHVPVHAVLLHHSPARLAVGNNRCGGGPSGVIQITRTRLGLNSMESSTTRLRH